MRKMMLAATMMLAACGTSDPADTNGSNDDGSGSDGSGSDGSGGMDAGVPTACTSAEDCGGGAACDIATHECVTGMLTIAPSQDVVVDGTRWWTATSNPVLHGTFQGPTGAMVQVIVGTNAPIAATLQGSNWSAVLPQGAIGAGDNWVKVVMTDPSGGHVELMQLFSLDTIAPQIALQTSKVRDERGDAIDFSTGEPIHTHAGAEIDLATGACPAVYKYPYLMDANAPLYGSATSPNPLAWKFTIADAKLDPTSKSFRVRTDANQTLLNWSAVPAPDASGTHRIELTRAGSGYPLAQLGTRTGKFYIDVKARDWNGLESTVSWCFDYHPLAAPLQVMAFEQEELFGMTLTGDSQISKFMNSGGAVDLVSQRIVQHTAEPVAFSWSATAGQVHYSKSVFYDYVIETDIGGDFCNKSPDACTIWTPTPMTPAITTSNGVFTPSLHTVLRDETTGTTIAESASLSISYQLPARQANEAPHTYRVVVISAPMGMLQSPQINLWWDLTAEYQLMGLTYTGLQKVAAGKSCASIFQSAWGPLCDHTSYFWKVSAIDQLHLDIDALSVTPRGGVGAQANEDLAHVTAATRTTGPLVWDSGNDNLPGAY